MNKKLIIIISSLVLFFIALLVIILYFQLNSVSAVSGKFKKVVIKNQWANDDDYKSCKKDQKNCISMSALFIKNGLQLRAQYTNYNLETMDKAFDEINTLIKEKDYKEALVKSQEVIESVNQNYNDYVSANKSNFNEIDKKIMTTVDSSFAYSVINYRIIEGWAIATLLPEKSGDVANIILEKTQDKDWAVRLGPGSYFDNELFTAFPTIPSKIKAYANTIDSIVIVYNPEYKKPTGFIDTANLTKQATIDPLTEHLPYFSDKFTVESTIVNGLPVYTVSYYEIAGNTPESVKASFRAWLNEINVSVNEASVKYEILQMPDYSGLSE